MCRRVRETRPPEENKERRTVETSKFCKRPPTRMVSPTAAPQNFLASFLPQELKITTAISSRQSAACSKNSDYFLYFLCDLVLSELAQSILVQLRGFTSPSPSRRIPTISANMLVRSNKS